MSIYPDIIRKTVKDIMDEPKEVKIRCKGYIPKELINGDWIDLKTAEAVTFKKGEYKEISLGIAMEIPEGYEAIVAPRSSTYKKYGIIMVNSIGIIDESYNGDGDIWRYPALAIRDTEIPEGTRIAQFRLLNHQPFIKFKLVDSLDNEDRGGIGSTGDK